MAKYLIEGRTVESEKPLTDAEIDEIADSISSAFSGTEFQPTPTGTVVDQIPTGGQGTVPFRPTQNLSTGQKFYQNIFRPVLAPTIETAGAIGGGLLGGTAGTFGAGPVGTATGGVFGAGMGYGLAKEGLEALDVGLGIKPPRQGAAIVTEPLRNVVEGAAFEAGGRVVAPLVTRGVNKVIDLASSSQLKASNIARSALGNDLPKVLDTLKNSPANASVAEVTASIDNPTWQALIKEALNRDPQFLRKIKLFGEDESLKALSKLVGGGNATEVRTVLDNAKKALNVTTTPQREAALIRANLGKYVAEYEATAGKLSEDAAAKVAEVRRLIELGDVAAAAARLKSIKAGIPASSSAAPAKSQAGFSDEWVKTYTYEGKLAQMSDDWAAKAADASLDLGQGARFNQAAANSLRSVGIKPLKTDSLIASIKGITKNPKFAGNKDLLNSVNAVADDIAQWTDGNGVIDVQALEAIRKNSVNGVIQRLYPNADATAQARLASQVVGSIRPFIDDAIEATGGAGWKKYLFNYREGSQKIAERKLTGEALRLWKTNKDEFVRLVQNESPEAVEEILGVGKYDIAKELSDSTMDVLKAQAEKRLTQISVNQQISEGQSALTQLLKEQTSMVRLPSWFSFWASAGNRAVSELEKAVGNKSMKILTDALKTPQGTADLLNKLPASEKQRITELLTNPSSIREMSQAAEE